MFLLVEKKRFIFFTTLNNYVSFNQLFYNNITFSWVFCQNYKLVTNKSYNLKHTFYLFFFFIYFSKFLKKFFKFFRKFEYYFNIKNFYLERKMRKQIYNGDFSNFKRKFSSFTRIYYLQKLFEIFNILNIQNEISWNYFFIKGFIFFYFYLNMIHLIFFYIHVFIE